MKVLVIEDTITSATVVCSWLINMGLSALHASNGEAGLEMFLREQPDLILLDIVMPGMDGFEVARKIRQCEKEKNSSWTPIIFLTARADENDLQRGIEAGGDDYLIKPVSEIVLKSKINAMYRMAQMRDSLRKTQYKLEKANLELQRLSAIDSLTGIANRRNFDASLLREWRRCSRSSSALSLLMVDVDMFKLFNDHYLHQMGDECLKIVAHTLAETTQRPNDMVARYGGEEFSVILPETESEGALAVAEAMRLGIEGLRIDHAWSGVSPVVTISVGVATVIPPRDDETGIPALIKAADDALYRAKEGGRNQVKVATGVIRVAGIGAASVIGSGSRSRPKG
ncbi:MAG: diguanylate cyclase [Azoarcus sp.]|jgi:diguanylate cyclase (GGDEF)-like protein|nr:diguanylate cyclase [Azoarcus sp.]